MPRKPFVRICRLLIAVGLVGLGSFFVRVKAQDLSPTSSPEATSSPSPSPSPSATPTPSATPFAEGNCLDFGSQQEAQTFFEANGGPEADPNELDPDGNGIACESLNNPDIIVEVLAAQGELKSCDDFSTQAEAQQFFISQGGPDLDHHDLDENANGQACDEHFSGTSAQTSPTPTTGAGATATPTSTATPRASALPRSGGPIQSMGIAGIALTTVGLALTAYGRRRGAHRRKPPPHDDYSLITW